MSALAPVVQPLDCVSASSCAPGGRNRPERPPIRRAFVVIECVVPSMRAGTEREEEAMQYVEVQVGGHYANSPRYVALVDHADAEAISAHRWSMSKGYADRTTWTGGKRLHMLMHRALLGLGPGDPDVDHVNGDTLDNRRVNLRVANHSQNQQNLHGRPYRGTTWNAARSLWQAQVVLAGKCHYLGCFATREDAAAVAAAFRRDHMPFSADARANGSLDLETSGAR
jgi:hypothetical protein